MRSEIERVQDIAKSIARIELLTASGKDQFEQDEATQESVIFHFEIIGEAANGISRETLANYPEVSWAEVVGLRNILVHHYWDVDLETLWSISQTTLPVLKQVIERMLVELN